MPTEGQRGADVAVAMLSLFPPKLRMSILEDADFRERFELRVDAKIRLGGFGGEFKRSTLLRVVRQVLGKVVSSAQIESKDGKTWLVTLEAGAIAVAHEGAAVVLPEMLSLSPDVNARTQWFEQEVAKCRVADEGIRKWQLVLAARPLEDDEFDLLLDEFRLTPAHTAASIGERVRRGNFKPSDLVPSDLRYFHRLVGESAGDSSMPAFMSTVVASHAQRLMSQNPFEGLKAAFLLSSHHLAAEVIDLGAVPNGDLLHVYEWLVESGDCISQIGAIECGLRHLDTIPELEPSLIAMVRALAIDDAADAGGRLKLLSSLVALVEGELARQGIARKQQPFWRRQASIAHASLIEREMTAAKLEFAGISEWALKSGGALYYLQTLVDARQEPRWFPDSVSPQQLKAEFVSRIANAGERWRKNVREGELSSLLWGVDPATIASQRAFPSGYLPGPLEGGTDATIEMPAELETSIRASLEAEELSPESFFGLVNSSLIFHIGSQLSELAAQGLRRVGYQLRKGKANTAPFSMLNGLAMVGAVTRSRALAGEVRVLARAARRRAGSKLSPDEMVRIALVAAAANREAAPWAAFLGEWLTELAFIDMTYDEAVRLQNDLYALLHLEPQLWETSGRAEAALSALVQSFPDA